MTNHQPNISPSFRVAMFFTIIKKLFFLHIKNMPIAHIGVPKNWNSNKTGAFRISFGVHKPSRRRFFHSVVQVGPTYVCLTFGSFVCTTCSGLHREFSHKVKAHVWHFFCGARLGCPMGCGCIDR